MIKSLAASLWSYSYISIRCYFIGNIQIEFAAWHSENCANIDISHLTYLLLVNFLGLNTWNSCTQERETSRTKKKSHVPTSTLITRQPTFVIVFTYCPLIPAHCPDLVEFNPLFQWKRYNRKVCRYPCSKMVIWQGMSKLSSKLEALFSSFSGFVQPTSMILGKADQRNIPCPNIASAYKSHYITLV